ncbi:hypothetical protein DPMN_166361 [Dreissena polymorpha]|uniref:Uncharacterized protein n=1 Tax=Dreissena polymorpha TaxID=45954 RepID=A0A9D4IU33_DREPO|nr:hypothetical protein DPMN_166361 [Dreissena polymorpha]
MSVALILSDVTPYFMTCGSHARDNCIFLWNKATCSRVATFTLDEMMRLHITGYG